MKPVKLFKRYNSAKFMKKKLENSSDSLLNQSQKIHKNSHSVVDDSLVIPHEIHRQRNKSKNSEIKNLLLKTSNHSSISDFSKLKNNSPTKSDISKLMGLNTSQYKDIFIHRKSLKKQPSIVKVLGVGESSKSLLIETKNISFSLKIDPKERNMDANKDNGVKIFSLDKQYKRSTSNERKKTDSSCFSIEKRKFDNILYSNKLKYVKLNYPKYKNATQQIVFANKKDKVLFLFSKSKY